MWARDGASLLAVGSPAMVAGHARLLRLYGAAGPTPTSRLGWTAMCCRARRATQVATRRKATTAARSSSACVTVAATHLYGVGPDGGEGRPIVAEPHQVVSTLSVAAEAPRAAIVLTTP